MSNVIIKFIKTLQKFQSPNNNKRCENVLLLLINIYNLVRLIDYF